jgi:hypothetical protein
MRIRSHFLALALVLAYAAAFRLATLNRPFFDDAEGSGCQIGVLARNYFRFPWTRTYGMPVLSSGSAGSAAIVFYPDHPPMLPLTVAASYAAFGVGPWQTRLPIAVVTLATILVLYLLLARFATPRIGLIAAALFAATPMVLTFGGFPDVVGLPLVFFVLLTLFAYLRFHRAPRAASFAALLGAFALAGLCDWPAYVLVPVLVVHFAATRPRQEWAWIATFTVAACALFAAVYVYITLATGSPWGWMLPLFRRRSSLVGAAGFTPRQWIAKAAAINAEYQTTVLSAAAVLGLLATPVRSRSRDGSPGTTVAALLLAWAAVYVAIGSKALYSHEWAWVPLTPAMAVVAAQLIDWPLRAATRRRAGTTAGWAAGVLIAMFAAWTAAATLRTLHSPELRSPYTPMEVADALRIAAPRADDIALLVGGEAQAQYWFYGDRPIRTDIWTADEFQARVDDRTVDTMYHFDVQPWPGPAAGLVFPRIWEDEFAPLREYLAVRYPLTPLPPALASKFEVFDLRRALR